MKHPNKKAAEMTVRELAAYIDYSVLKPEFTEEEINRFSLERVIKANTAPMFLWHTVEDSLVPVKGTLQLAEALVDAKIPFKMSIYPYGPHGLALGTEVTNTFAGSAQEIGCTWTAEADQWMKTIADYEY